MPKDLRIGIAEVSIALTGFAGVVVVLGRRSSGPWPLADQFQLRSLIENGLFVVVAALLPFAIFELTADTRLTWRIASGIFGVAALGHVFVVQGFYRERRLRRDTPEPSSLFPRASGPVVGLASLAVHGALLLNAAEVAFHGIFAPYLCALMWDLCIGAFFFIRLVRFT